MSADNEIYTQLDRITDHLATMTKQERIAWFRRSAYVQPLNFLREIDGTTYTSLAVSYRNKTIEELIGGSAYGGQSDCYIIHPDGDVMLSEEPKSEIEDWMDNLFDYRPRYYYSNSPSTTGTACSVGLSLDMEQMFKKK